MSGCCYEYPKCKHAEFDGLMVVPKNELKDFAKFVTARNDRVGGYDKPLTRNQRKAKRRKGIPGF